MTDLLNWVVERLKEPSTYAGLAIVARSLHLQFTQPQQSAIVTAGIAFAGLLAVLIPEKKKP